MIRSWPGSPHPLGATWDGEGTNFAIFSEHATAVELCLFETPDATAEAARVPLTERTDQVWHVYLPDVRPGQHYGYRVHGPYAPEQGHRFNPAKLLLDPYAKAISTAIRWSDSLFGYKVGAPDDPEPDSRDSAEGVVRSVVVETAFSWGDDRAPRTPWNRTVIYECHVKGMTALHPDVPAALRGTYLGLATEPVIEHLHSLGVTAVELLPVQQFAVDRHLVERSLTNYWGYNTIGYFAPDVRYATAGGTRQVSEFKSMVKRLHRAGLEVILDVVYNHSAEGNHLGPTLCFRGIDNAAYYWLDPNDPSRYLDYTGCGNSLNLQHSRTMQMVMDSLRYWAGEMHVDGFRFDLAPTLAREREGVNMFSKFFDVVRQDPIISQMKLIAEPWDLGEGGYQIGRFPIGWAEWNGRYRDTVRRFWRGQPAEIGDLASRLSGSSDLYETSGRTPQAGVNFMTCHDGFTLHDLVSYDGKHNEANKEDNRDGNPDNDSRNWGAEGPTDSTHILRMRERIKRNFLATLAFSQGVPMLSHGDEVGRTQQGNNNVYCQDNELSWIDWDLDETQQDLLEFTRRILRIRAANPVFRRRTFFRREPGADGQAQDLWWLRADGGEMRAHDWRDENAQILGMMIKAAATDELDDRGRPFLGETILLLVNGGPRTRPFVLPELPEAGTWEELINTARPAPRSGRERSVNLVAHSLILLRHSAAD